MSSETKNATKSKKKQEKQPDGEPTEWDDMDVDSLRQAVSDLERELERASSDRGRAQAEREAARTCRDVVRRRVGDAAASAAAGDDDAETRAERRWSELGAYTCKASHLSHLRSRRLEEARLDLEGAVEEEGRCHGERYGKLLEENEALREAVRDNDREGAEEIGSSIREQEDFLGATRDGFEEGLRTLEDAYMGRVRALEGELELRKEVRLDETEEMANRHMRDLENGHSKAIEEMEVYYNRLVEDNERAVETLSKEIARAKGRADAHAAEADRVATENERLREPLADALVRLEDAKGRQKEREKVIFSLKLVKSRITAVRKRLGKTKDSLAEIKRSSAAAEGERDDLCARLGAVVEGVGDTAQRWDEIDMCTTDHLKEVAISDRTRPGTAERRAPLMAIEAL